MQTKKYEDKNYATAVPVDTNQQEKPKMSTLIVQEGDNVSILTNGRLLMQLQGCELIYTPDGLRIENQHGIVAEMAYSMNECGWSVKIVGVELFPID